VKARKVSGHQYSLRLRRAIQRLWLPPGVSASYDGAAERDGPNFVTAVWNSVGAGWQRGATSTSKIAHGPGLVSALARPSALGDSAVGPSGSLRAAAGARAHSRWCRARALAQADSSAGAP